MRYDKLKGTAGSKRQQKGRKKKELKIQGCTTSAWNPSGIIPEVLMASSQDAPPLPMSSYL